MRAFPLLPPLLLLLPAATSLNNTQGRTPPMGFNPWTAFRSNFNATVLLDVADAMDKRGLVAAGYRQVIVLLSLPLTSSRHRHSRIATHAVTMAASLAPTHADVTVAVSDQGPYLKPRLSPHPVAGRQAHRQPDRQSHQGPDS